LTADEETTNIRYKEHISTKYSREESALTAHNTYPTQQIPVWYNEECNRCNQTHRKMAINEHQRKFLHMYI
jgi:hypothetical protein